MQFEIPSDIAGELKKLDIADDREACVSLAEFAKRSWHVLEPATPMKWGKALDVMCSHLEALAYGTAPTNRHLCNVPPGMMKSLLYSVIFPAWVWTFAPSKSFTGASHEQGLAVRDARKMRLLIESEWYQERWPLKLAGDANAKMNFENEHRGFRQAVPFRSMTGRRSDFVIIDDPHSAEDANSVAARAEAIRIFRETLPTRVNNDNSVIIVIMQRLHEEDISGLILSNNFNYDTLILPMRFDPERADPDDWRTVEGELLFPERFSEDSVADLEAILGSYASAGQLAQRPVSREGGMFKLAWFDNRYVTSVPEGTRWKRWWDLAATKDKNAARTAGVLLGRTPQGRYIIGHSATCQEEPHRRNEFIKAQCEADVARFGRNVEFYIPRDPGAGGKETAMALVQHLDGFNVRAIREVGDKESRAEPFSAACEGGNVDILQGDWVKPFLDELTIFPGGKWKDQVDAVVNAHARFVAEPKRNTSFAGYAPKILDIAS